MISTDNIEEKAREWLKENHPYTHDIHDQIAKLAAFARSLAHPPIAGKEAIREALGDAQHHLSNNRIGEVCIELDRALALLRAEPEPTPTYLSRDYEALYDLLCKGGEALARVVYTGPEQGAKWLHKPEPYTSMALTKSTNFGGIYVSVDGDQRAEFIAHCQRLSLEWVAPSPDLARIKEAGEAMRNALVAYQMDVDEDPPYKHRAMITAWDAAIR
jgi:hypothetical protein